MAVLEIIDNYMKINKKTGKIRLEANEVRIGNNFFVKKEGEHIKLYDINGVFFHSAMRTMPIGIWLENQWARAMNGDDVQANNTLMVYISTMWSLFSVAPDDEYIADVLRIAKEALERHPDWYGYNPSDDDKENDEALQEVKEMKEFEQEIKNLPDGTEEEKEEKEER